MLNHSEINETLSNLGFTQPIKGKNGCWVKANPGITVYFACKALLSSGGACYVICKGLERFEAFSAEELKVKCYEMERRMYDNA